jgi:hypothetical protein
MSVPSNVFILVWHLKSHHIAINSKGMQIMYNPLTYPDSKVLWGGVNPAIWGEGTRNVLETEGTDLDQAR